MEPELYIPKNISKREASAPKVIREESHPSAPKPVFSKFVPVVTSTTQSQAKPKKSMDLQSLFGSHSDEEEETKQDTAIKVNRKTMIHYAVHRTGEK